MKIFLTYMEERADNLLQVWLTETECLNEFFCHPINCVSLSDAGIKFIFGITLWSLRLFKPIYHSKDKIFYQCQSLNSDASFMNTTLPNVQSAHVHPNPQLVWVEEIIFHLIIHAPALICLPWNLGHHCMADSFWSQSRLFVFWFIREK